MYGVMEENGVGFSGVKSKIMLVNTSEDERNTTWRVDGNE